MNEFSFTDCYHSEHRWANTNFSDTRFATDGIFCPANIQASVVHRRTEFFFGRLSARDAIRKIDPNFDATIAIGKDRYPQWPLGIIGSITHCKGYAAALVGERDTYVGIGLDAEPLMTQQQVVELGTMIASADEMVLMQSTRLSLTEQLTVLFSAKESFYKATYPLHKTILEFHDVALVGVDVDRRLNLQLLKKGLRGLRLNQPLESVYHIDANLIKTYTLIKT